MSAMLRLLESAVSFRTGTGSWQLRQSLAHTGREQTVLLSDGKMRDELVEQ